MGPGRARLDDVEVMPRPAAVRSEMNPEAILAAAAGPRCMGADKGCIFPALRFWCSPTHDLENRSRVSYIAPTAHSGAA
jgi:hypothetical protein